MRFETHISVDLWFTSFIWLIQGVFYAVLICWFTQRWVLHKEVLWMYLNKQMINDSLRWWIKDGTWNWNISITQSKQSSFTVVCYSLTGFQHWHECRNRGKFISCGLSGALCWLKERNKRTRFLSHCFSLSPQLEGWSRLQCSDPQTQARAHRLWQAEKGEQLMREKY